MMGSHGIFGKGVMYEEALHIPLIVRPPSGVQGWRADALVSSVDFLPTLLDLCGLPPAATAEDVQLRPAHPRRGRSPAETPSSPSMATSYVSAPRPRSLLPRGRRRHPGRSTRPQRPTLRAGQPGGQSGAPVRRETLRQTLVAWHQRCPNSAWASIVVLPPSPPRVPEAFELLGSSKVFRQQRSRYAPTP